MKGRADYRRKIGAVRQSKHKRQQVDETSPAERRDTSPSLRKTKKAVQAIAQSRRLS